MRDSLEIKLSHFLRAEAKHLAILQIGPQEPARNRLDLGNTHSSLLEQHPKSSLAFAERLLDALPLFDFQTEQLAGSFQFNCPLPYHLFQHLLASLNDLSVPFALGDVEHQRQDMRLAVVADEDRG